MDKTEQYQTWKLEKTLGDGKLSGLKLERASGEY